MPMLQPTIPNSINNSSLQHSSATALDTSRAPKLEAVSVGIADSLGSYPKSPTLNTAAYLLLHIGFCVHGNFYRVFILPVPGSAHQMHTQISGYSSSAAKPVGARLSSWMDMRMRIRLSLPPSTSRCSP